MATSTLLCIHQNHPQLKLLQEHGYELATATNSSDGLRLIRSRSVDAVVVENGPTLDGLAIADEIKQLRPGLPVIMLVENTEMPAAALRSIDALVANADGPHFLLATVHFMLTVRPKGHRHRKPRPKTIQTSPQGIGSLTTGELSAPFSDSIWQGIKNGNIRF